MAEGTRCVTNAAGPEPGGELRTDVAILGSGPGGLSAAWQLSRAGHRDFIMLDGPEFGGNAAGGQFGEIGFPRGAHYLPLPSAQSTHVREMLADVGVIERDPFDARPRFDERALVHAPDERLFFDGNGRTACCPIMTITMRSTRFLTRMDALQAAPAAMAARHLRFRSPNPRATRHGRRSIARPSGNG
jgi:phytoene dehydrogenase-like protein